MKNSSSKPAISTSPENQCSLYNIKYCLKICQNVWLKYYVTVPITGIFTKPPSPSF